MSQFATDHQQQQQQQQSPHHRHHQHHHHHPHQQQPVVPMAPPNPPPTITPVLSVSALIGHDPSPHQHQHQHQYQHQPISSPIGSAAISPTVAMHSRTIAPSLTNFAGPPSASLSDSPVDQSDKRGHQRVYQACIPCRRRKVRCDLGPVDAPQEPPCARCKRESKECYFSATRRKRKNDDPDADEAPDPVAVDQYLVRNGRKRRHTDSTPPAPDRSLYDDPPLTPGGSVGRSQPLRKPEAKHKHDHGGGGGPDAHSRATDLTHGEANAQLENLEAQNVMRRGVFGPHDALDLLYKAATDTDGPGALHARDTMSSVMSQDHFARDSPLATPNRHPSQHHHYQQQQPQQRIRQHQTSVSTVGAGSTTIKAEPTNESRFREHPYHRPTLAANPRPPPQYDPDALKVWSRFRFVKAGWFSAQEAIEYIKYYYDYLSPLTPISPPTFQDETTHMTLLTEEPVLTVTLLTIASRYRQIPGPGGHCRSDAIHTQLWTYLRGMIERCLWGQEAYGGGILSAAHNGYGFGGGGAEEGLSSSTAPSRGLRKGSLRTLGTIESLMILTEWHPRALNFPPDDAIYELMAPEPDLAAHADDGGHKSTGGAGGLRLDSWLEPAWRSDRMCWMLLSAGLGLAYELGVFDDVNEMVRDGTISRPEYEDEAYRQRAHRIKRLLMIYPSQLAGRLGWTSMVPDNLWKVDAATGRRRPASHEGTTPVTTLSSFSVGFNYIPDLELDDQVIHCWAGISHAMHVGSQRLFKSRTFTTNIIQSGKYLQLLREFKPILSDWLVEFERFRLPPYIRHILTIEYQYVRIYINSLSLQAVVERCTSTAGGAAHPPHHTAGGGGGIHGQGQGHGHGEAAQLSPQTQNYYGQLPLSHLGSFSTEDQQHVREVVDGCRDLLRTVVEGLLPRGYLKHAPIRTYFRILSGAMFLLKTFALGASRADVKISIDLMDRAVEALRNCVVDDVHPGTRFADLLESLTSRLRNRFIQVPTSMLSGGNGGDGAEPVLANGSQEQVGVGDWGARVNERLSAAPHDADRSATPGISATPFDPRMGVFPYSGAASAIGPSTPAPMDPGHSHHGHGGSHLMLDEWIGNGAGAGDGAGVSEMWYLPPGAAFFQNVENNAVSMTAEGINVNGLDLLDYMTMDSNYDGGY